MRVVRVALPPHRLDAGLVVTLPPHSLHAGRARALPPDILLARGCGRLPPDILHAGTTAAAGGDAVIISAVLIPERDAVAGDRRAHVQREGARSTGAPGRPGRQFAEPLLKQIATGVVGVQIRPIDPG